MRAVVQRVKEGSVTVDGNIVGKIGAGLLVLLGIAKSDTIQDIDYIADKILNLRIFEDENGKMNRSVLDTGGEMLVVSQFTLLGDCRKGRRPSYTDAAEPERANELYEKFAETVRGNGIKVETGIFRAMMDVSLINDGPVTLIVESKLSVAGGQ
jgi:D-aminoacyl-tRNA deacylase